MGNKSFESKMNNASHDYVDGRHYAKPHPDASIFNEYKAPGYDKQKSDEESKRKEEGKFHFKDLARVFTPGGHNL